MLMHQFGKEDGINGVYSRKILAGLRWTDLLHAGTNCTAYERGCGTAYLAPFQAMMLYDGLGEAKQSLILPFQSPREATGVLCDPVIGATFLLN